MKNYTVSTGSESYETDSFEDALSVMESMAEHFGQAIIRDNKTNKILDEIKLR